MRGIDLIVAALAITLVAGTIWYNVRKKMRGESTCGYNCSSCGIHKKKGSCH